MKRGLIALVLGFCWIGLSGCATTTYGNAADQYRDNYDYAPPPDEDVSYFYDALEPYGDWFWDETYGWAWYPLDVAVDWRPYTYGQWIWTDEGWTWASDWEWGWAPFHYGRWFDHPDYGWCWIPGGEWAPAWVAWREGDGWIGWAPLPPEVEWRVGVGLTWNDWDRLPGVRHYAWSFCREGELPGSEVQRRLAPLPKNVILVRDTRNVTDYGFVGAHVVNRSLGIGQIRTAYRRDIPTYHVADAPKPLTKPANRLQRDRYYAFRPPLAKAPEGRSPRVAESPRQGTAPPSTPPVVRGGAYGRGRYGAEQESKQLPRRQAAERKQLEAEHQREMRAPPPGVDQNELRRQHEEEQRALAEQAARDRRVLEGRRQQEQRRDQQKPPQEQPRQSKEKGERRAPLPKGSQADKQDDSKRPDAKRPDKQADREESRRK